MEEYSGKRTEDKISAIEIPEPISDALSAGASLAISISGGKDSQAMLYALERERKAQGWTGYIFAIHAHLGRMEWPQSLAHCERICADINVPLIIVRRPQGDLLQEMQERMVKLQGTGKPHFPDSKNRYCTSHHKTSQIDKALRTHELIISAEGLRAEESPARAKRPAWEYRTQICTRQRTAYTWRPIINWTEDQVWREMGSSTGDIQQRREMYRSGDYHGAFTGWAGHPAYIMGNQRLSCAICVLASRNDIINGARCNSGLWRALVAMEDESGFSFRQDLRLGSLQLQEEVTA